jgi:hypothetical protein
MLPTIYKSKISGRESYPVTAREISEGLVGSPQVANLSLEFHAGWKTRLRSQNPYHDEIVRSYFRPPTILEVGYGWVPKESDDREFLFTRGWLVVVLPVAREQRHRLNELIRHDGLPAMKQCLIERQPLKMSNAHGIQSFRVAYDEQADTLLHQHYQSPGETFQ